jgi:hypothetical protein
LKPSPENFQSDNLYQDALAKYYEQISIFYFFHPFDEEEIKKMKAIGKEFKIPKPKESSPTYEEDIQEYYKTLYKLLPGYIFKMKTTSI